MKKKIYQTPTAQMVEMKITALLSGSMRVYKEEYEAAEQQGSSTEDLTTDEMW